MFLRRRVQVFLLSPPGPQPMRALQVLQKDGQGLKNQFPIIMAIITLLPSRRMDPSARARVFKKMDKDKSGSIDREEFQRGVVMCGLGFSPEQVPSAPRARVARASCARAGSEAWVAAFLRRRILHTP